MVGPGLRPWVVPMRTLTRALQAVQRLLEQHDEDRGEQQQTAVPHDSVLHLIGLKAGSAVYNVASGRSEATVKLLRMTGDALSAPDDAEWSSALLSSVEDLSEVAKSLGCEIEFRLPSTGREAGGVLAKITPQSYETVASQAFSRGFTSVYAKIERVGGATKMHCGIRIPRQDRKMVICRVANKQLVQELGKHLYDDVVVCGEATWLRHNWEIQSMRITAIESPKQGSIMQTLDDLYEVGGKAWDEVGDSARYLREMREE